MNLTCIVFGILFVAAGALYAAGKLHTHMSVWKNMPQEEKDQIRIGPLCRNIGGMILVCGVIFLLKGFWHSFSHPWFTGIMMAWLIACGLDVWFIRKSKRYKNP